MTRLPIRWKITLWSAAAASGALLAFTAGALANLYLDQIDTVDLEMKNEALHLASAPPGETHYGTWLQEILPGEPPMACSIGAANTRFLGNLPASPAPFARLALGHARPRNLRFSDGNWRVCTYRIDGRDLLLAFDLYEVSDRVEDLFTACLLALPLAAIVAALGGWVVASHALAPVRAATETAAAIGAGALDLRLPPALVDDEIGRLSTVLNQMLDRLEKSFRQSTRFAADASHELRTPLTIMQGELDALISQAHHSPALEDSLLSLRQEITRLNRITEHLLLLALFDAGRAASVREPVDLSALTEEACEDAELLAAVWKTRLEKHVTPSIIVTGDPAQLRRVVLNLLDNACKFNVPQGLVRCSLDLVGGFARLTVANSGQGIPAELRPRLFDRFFRADTTRKHAGHGLGLSLCREIILAHGGKITLKEGSADAPVEFVVTLPISVAT